jgi:hypothetical protein
MIRSGTLMRDLPSIKILVAAIAIAATPRHASPVAAAEQVESLPALDQEVRRLIGELAGQTRSQRSAAEKRLLELGPQALPHLPAAELLPSNSVREAVRRIRLELERRQARESVLPARVTLDGPHSLAEILAEMTRQTGNVVDGRSLPAELLEREVELSAAAVPFWQVVDDLSERLKVRYEYDTGLRGLRFLSAIGSRPVPASATGYAGAFRIEAPLVSRLERSAPTRVAGGGWTISRNLLRVTLRVRPEPRLRPLFLQFAANEISVRAADNRELPPFSPDASYELSLAEGASQAPIQMDYVAPDGGEIGPLAIKGKMRCTTAAANEAFRFAVGEKSGDPKAETISRRRGGVTVSLTRVLHHQRELRIQILVAYETGGPAFESHRSWIFHNDAYLENAAGKQFRLNGGTETVQQGERTLGIEYRFVELPDPLPGFTFVYVAPTLIIDVPIEFEIESVPVAARSTAPKVNK